MFGMEFYVDPSRCIGCQSCLKACEECDTHRGISMIDFDWPRERSANLLTHRTLDSRSKIPEFKVSACRISKAAAPGGRS